MPKPSPRSSTIVVDNCEIDLKNRYVATVLAALIPGAGHFYQGRKKKALLFATCILFLFVAGMIIGRGRVIYASWTADDFRIQFPAQACIGLPAAPALLQAWVAKSDPNRRFLNGFMAAPPIDNFKGNNHKALSQWHEQASAGFELGTLYTAVAGLLNLLVVFDAFAGPMPMPVIEDKRKKKGKNTDPASPEGGSPTNTSGSKAASPSAPNSAASSSAAS
jgi:hypothetical protein